MAQGVFGGLRRGIGAFRERAERGHIDEIPLVPAANVQLPGRGGHHGLRSHGGLAGDVEAGGKVVGAPLGQIAQQGTPVQPHQAGDHLVQRAVAAHGHHSVVAAAFPGGDLLGLAGGVGAADGQQVARPAENGGGVKQGTAGLVPAGPGVDDHQ